MSFFKSFAASLLAWVIGVAVLIIGSVSVIVGALLSMESSQKPIENNTVLYFDLNEEKIALVATDAHRLATMLATKHHRCCKPIGIGFFDPC